MSYYVLLQFLGWYSEVQVNEFNGPYQFVPGGAVGLIFIGFRATIALCNHLQLELQPQLVASGFCTGG